MIGRGNKVPSTDWLLHSLTFALESCSVGRGPKTIPDNGSWSWNFPAPKNMKVG